MTSLPASDTPSSAAKLAGGAVSLLAVPAALAAGFGAFGTALWTNIHVDGDPSATTAETMLAVAFPTLLFVAPAVIVVVLARALPVPGLPRAFGIAATLSLALLTFGYGLVPMAAVGIPWAVALRIRDRRLRWPPLDLIAVVSYFLMFWFFAYAEAHR